MQAHTIAVGAFPGFIIKAGPGAVRPGTGVSPGTVRDRDWFRLWDCPPADFGFWVGGSLHKPSPRVIAILPTHPVVRSGWDRLHSVFVKTPFVRRGRALDLACRPTLR